MYRMLIVVSLAALLAGCPQQTVRTNMQSNDYRTLAGSRLQLLQPLDIPPGRTRLFIQHGKVLQGNSADQYDTQCNFEVEDLSKQVQRIEPDSFLIERVQALTEPVVLTRPVMVAALGGVASLAGVGDDGASDIFQGYNFWLSSARQPQVMRLTCVGAYDTPSDARAPTLQEIRKTLAGIARIETGQ
jgi:hypothetical protein